MTDAQAEGSTEVPAGTPPRSPLFPALQLLAFAAIAGLLALLIWRLVAANRGAELVKDPQRQPAGGTPRSPFR